uniref:Uncharacterized protein n=1 Tax=Meloidogyne javanica TaxID=6303 RepID=A0A915MZ75_MELJA
MESSNLYQFEFHEEHQERPQKHFYPRQDPNVTATTIETKYYSREIPPRIYSRNGDNTRRRSSISYNEYNRYETDRLNTKYCIEPSGVLRIIEIVEAYYSTGGWANNCNDIGGDGIIHNGCRLIIEWAFASISNRLNSC